MSQCSKVSWWRLNRGHCCCMLISLWMQLQHKRVVFHSSCFKRVPTIENKSSPQGAGPCCWVQTNQCSPCCGRLLPLGALDVHVCVRNKRKHNNHDSLAAPTPMLSDDCLAGLGRSVMHMNSVWPQSGTRGELRVIYSIAAVVLYSSIVVNHSRPQLPWTNCSKQNVLLQQAVV